MGLAAFAEYALVAEQSVVKIPSGLPPADMCVFGCAVLCGAGSAINTSGVGKGDAVAVIGLGAVGLSAVLGSRAVGAGFQGRWRWFGVGIDRLDSKLEPARKVGADSVYSAESALEAGLESGVGSEEIEQPALVIHGAEDRVVPVANAALLADRIPESELVIRPDGGHNLMLEEPALISSRVRDFLETRS